jgi:hypothetical protein
LKVKLRRYVPGEGQFGFRREKVNEDVIGMLGIISE